MNKELNVYQMNTQWILKQGGPFVWTALELTAPGAQKRKASLWTKVTRKGSQDELLAGTVVWWEVNDSVTAAVDLDCARHRTRF